MWRELLVLREGSSGGGGPSGQQSEGDDGGAHPRPLITSSAARAGQASGAGRLSGRTIRTIWGHWPHAPPRSPPATLIATRALDCLHAGGPLAHPAHATTPAKLKLDWQRWQSLLAAAMHAPAHCALHSTSLLEAEWRSMIHSSSRLHSAPRPRCCSLHTSLHQCNQPPDHGWAQSSPATGPHHRQRTPTSAQAVPGSGADAARHAAVLAARRTESDACH
jgi:hypothetical protein